MTEDTGKEIPKVNKPTDYKHVIVDDKGKPVLGSQLGREPEYVAKETFKKEEKIDYGKATKKKVTGTRLDTLSKDYYLFTMAPVYYMLPVKVDFIYQFGVDILLEEVDDVILYRAQSPLFTGLGEWGLILHGIPHEHKELFSTWVNQLVFPDRTVKPNRYWRVNNTTVAMLTPGVVSTTADVDIYTPSGIDCSFKPVLQPDGQYGFVKKEPEEWIVNEANRFFLRTS